MTAQTWSFGPFAVTYYPEQNAPDSMQLYSTTAMIAAPQAVVASPLPPVGTTVILQVYIPNVFPFDARHVIQAGDTPASVAAALTAVIASGADNPANVAKMQAAGVFAGNTPGSDIIAVTQPPTGGLVLSDASSLAQSPFLGLPTPATISAWDAGPILALGKLPRDSNGNLVPPPPGSNIGQIAVVAPNSAGVPVQYLTIGFNVRDPATGDCEFAVYTQDTRRKILSLTVDGIVH